MTPSCMQNRHDPNTALITDAIHLLQEAVIGTHNPELIQNKFATLKEIRISPKNSDTHLVRKLLLKTMNAITNGGNGTRASKLQSILADAEEAAFLAMGAAA